MADLARDGLDLRAGDTVRCLVEGKDYKVTVKDWPEGQTRKSGSFYGKVPTSSPASRLA